MAVKEQPKDDGGFKLVSLGRLNIGTNLIVALYLSNDSDEYLYSAYAQNCTNGGVTIT